MFADVHTRLVCMGVLCVFDPDQDSFAPSQCVKSTQRWQAHTDFDQSMSLDSKKQKGYMIYEYLHINSLSSKAIQWCANPDELRTHFFNYRTTATDRSRCTCDTHRRSKAVRMEIKPRTERL